MLQITTIKLVLNNWYLKKIPVLQLNITVQVLQLYNILFNIQVCMSVESYDLFDTKLKTKVQSISRTNKQTGRNLYISDINAFCFRPSDLYITCQGERTKKIRDKLYQYTYK